MNVACVARLFMAKPKYLEPRVATHESLRLFLSKTDLFFFSQKPYHASYKLCHSIPQFTDLLSLYCFYLQETLTNTTLHFCHKELDLCHPNPCLNGGKCSRTEFGGYKCACAPGYGGTNCTGEHNDNTLRNIRRDS